MRSGGTGEQYSDRALRQEQRSLQIDTGVNQGFQQEFQQFRNGERHVDRFEEQSSVCSGGGYFDDRNRRQPTPTHRSKMSRGQHKQKISAQQIAQSSPLREAMLFLALASSTMQHFAMVILIPFICSQEHKSVRSYEIGLLIASSWAGGMIAPRFTERAISKMGTKWSIQLSFLFMVVASFAFWMITGVVNDSSFVAFLFINRFMFGLGAGLLRSVIIVARAQSMKGQKDVQPRDYFKWHMLAEAFGYFLGPLLLVITNYSVWDNDRTALCLALANMTVWFLFTLSFADDNSQSNQQRQFMAQQEHLDTLATPTAVGSNNADGQGMRAFYNLGSGFTMADNFIKSLLYNQVPLTAFLNRRSLLAFFALLIGFILVTFVLPFFALIRNRSSYEVSIQMTIVFAVFFLASIFGSYLMRCLGPKRITTLSLILATGACFLLGIESSDHDDGTQKIAKSDSGMQRIFDTIMMFADNAIAGYLLIVIAIALLTMASLEEVLSGTENKLLRTKFVNASNLHLFVESIFMVYSVMQLAHIIGPIVGGLINTELGMVQTCQVMGQIGAIAVFLYLVLGLWVHCTLHEENTLSLQDIEIDELDPEVRFATAQSSHALRSSMRLSTHNAGASAFTISQNRDRVREPQNRQQVRFAPHHTQTSPQRDSVLTEMKKEQ